ncbi:copper ion binding protein [Paenibacillus sp. KS-LC4]|uniref:copper ion binding protein n=1 Tax=Paenibacillus sp. KS-LC4 TaxID=2979727 RepID=UPI0030D2FAE5
MESVTLKVEGMSCGHCVSTVEKAINEAGASGKVDLAAGQVAVEFDTAKVSLASIKEAIENTGFDVV